MGNWRKIFSTEREYRAEIVKEVLTAKGITSIIVNKQDSSYKNFGMYEVHVMPDDAIKAIKIIEDDIRFD